MKKFRFIASLFFVILTLYPAFVGAMGSCDDEKTCCESNMSDEKESGDDCIDLCLCSCCGNSVFFDVKNEKLTDFSGTLFFANEIFTYQFQFSSNFLAEIWQPPKLSLIHI